MNSDTLIHACLNAQTLAKILFYISSIISTQYALLLSFYICFSAILRKNKLPKFNKQYLQYFHIIRELLLNEYSFCLFYVLIIYFVSHYSTFIQLIPLAMIYTIGLADYIVMKNIKIFGINSYANIIRQKRQIVYRTRAKIQILYVIPIIFMLFMGVSSIIFLLLYCQFLFMKYRVNQHTKWAAYQIHTSIFQKTRSLGPIKYIYDKFTSLCSYMVKT